MSTGWVLLSLLGPPIAALLAGQFFRGRPADPFIGIALNFLMPGAGLAALGRPVLETVLCVMYAQASLFITGKPDDWGYLVPIGIFGGLWAALHTSFNPFTISASPSKASAIRSFLDKGTPLGSVTVATPQAIASPEPEGQQEEAGYSVEVGCTECGADVVVPVLAHMARCGFCGSQHLVVGHEETLYVAVPTKVRSDQDLREAVLDHYRYQRYLKLYRSKVAPLEAQATEASPTGTLVTRPEVSAAVAAAEASVSRAADRYRAELAKTLELQGAQQFLAPYRHGMGTLFQAAFGRSKTDQEKLLRFAVGTIEASLLATKAADLPKMGKLSYLRALVPAAECGPEARTLPIEVDAEGLNGAFGRLDRKQLVRSIDVIRLGVRFCLEVTAVVWRPWWIVGVRAPGIADTLLVDGGAASVAGTAPHLNPEILEELPEAARAPGTGLRFVPMECPTCGDEFPFDTDAVLHFCRNCHRVCGLRNGRKRHLDYGYQPPPDEDGWEMAPFWYFPLSIRTGDGQRLTDLMHLKDGIDGSFDQIGDDAAVRRQAVLVPAFRCINSKLMAEAFERVFMYTLRHPPRITAGRFPMDDRPEPWSVSLDEDEARSLLPLYLAMAFGKRDLARVKVAQAEAWLFHAVQERKGHLAYLPLPRALSEPFRPYLGRYRTRAVRRAEKSATVVGR